MIVIVICIGFVLVWLGRLVLIVVRPSKMRIFVSAPVILAGGAFLCQVLPRQIDNAIGVTNLSDLLYETLGVVVMTTALLFLKTLRPPHKLRKSTVVYASVSGAALIGLLVTQWAIAPIHVAETPDDAGDWQALAGPWGFTTIIFHAFIIVGLCAIAWQCLYGSRSQFVEIPALRGGLILMGVGLAIGVGARTVIEIRLLSPPQDYARFTSLYWSVQVASIAVYSIGLALPAPALAVIRNTTHWRQVRCLNPLWSHLTGMFPEVLLPTKKIRTPAGLAVVTNRRFIEIGDCLSQLRLPRHVVDELLADSARRGTCNQLGAYLAAAEREPENLGDSERASSLLAPTATPGADREQLLSIADAFRRQLRRSRSSAPLETATQPAAKLSPSTGAEKSHG